MALPEPVIEPLSDVGISRLAREISRNLKPLALLLEEMHVDNDQWERIQNSEIFKTRLIEEAQTWASSTSRGMRDRIATKAAVMVEELLLDAVGIVKNGDIPGAARVASLQFLAKMGQLGEAAAVKDDGSGRVQINILIGGQKMSFDKDAPTQDIIDVTPGVAAP